MVKFYNVYECKALKILFESEDHNEVYKALEDEKQKGKTIIMGMKFKNN